VRARERESVCVCEREGERVYVRERESVCVCVRERDVCLHDVHVAFLSGDAVKCVCERERERESGRGRGRGREEEKEMYLCVRCIFV